METIVIKDFDTALKAVIEKYADPDFKGFTLAPDACIKIKMEGEQWDGRLDYKVGEFIIRLQKSLLDMYSAQIGTTLRYNTAAIDVQGLRITVHVEPGCTLFNIDLSSWWENMDAKHTVVAISIVAGLYFTGHYLEAIHSDNSKEKIATIETDGLVQQARIKTQAEVEMKVQERIQDETRQKTIVTSVTKALDVAAGSDQHLSYLASKMHRNDKMYIDGNILPAATAKSVFRTVTEVKDDTAPSRYFLDGDYVVTSINREKDVATIKFPDRKRSFSLVWLDEGAREAFYQKCSQGKVDKELLPMTLQLTALFSGGVFKEGFIQDIGLPREGSMTFQDASLASARKEEADEQSQQDEE